MTSIFFDPPGNQKVAKALLDASWAETGAAFASRAAHDVLFTYVLTPASSAWAFFSSGKTGTTSVLDALFLHEFGTPCTATVNDPTDMNRDAALHRTVQAGVFRPLHQRGDVTSISGYLAQALRIAAVRHPTTRAWSAFRYLCRSARLGHPQFAADRLRMTALVGMDWTEPPLTRDGFARFLDYIAAGQAARGTLPENNHWRPQVEDIRPDLTKPQILARMEAPQAWQAALASHLGAPARALSPHRNPDTEGASALPDWLAAPDLRKRLETVYAADYQAFGYDPEVIA